MLEFGPRFPDMARPYDLLLRRMALEIAEEQGYELNQGVYFGMSVITNEAHDDYADDYVNDGDDVVKAADAAADTMTALFTRIIERL